GDRAAIGRAVDTARDDQRVGIAGAQARRAARVERDRVGPVELRARAERFHQPAVVRTGGDVHAVAARPVGRVGIAVDLAAEEALPLGREARDRLGRLFDRGAGGNGRGRDDSCGSDYDVLRLILINRPRLAEVPFYIFAPGSLLACRTQSAKGSPSSSPSRTW